VLGEAALKLGIATVETEVGGMGTVTPEGQKTYRDVVLRFLGHFGVYEYRGEPACQPKIVGHVDVMSNYAGLFRSRVRPAQQVDAGLVLGTLHGLGGACLEEVRAPRDGIVAILRTFGSVQPGDRLIQLFREVT